MEFYVVINLNEVEHNIVLSPNFNRVGPLPFCIYLTADAYNKIHYTLDGSEPVIGAENTTEVRLPFLLEITEAETLELRFLATPEQENPNPIKNLYYYNKWAVDLPRVRPDQVLTMAPTKLQISGTGAMLDSTVIVNGESYDFELSGDNLTGTIPRLETGVYDTTINIINDISYVIYRSLESITPEVVLDDEDPLIEDKTVKTLFETTNGPMVLHRTLVKNYDIENIAENMIKQICMTEKLSIFEDDYPQEIDMEA